MITVLQADHLTKYYSGHIALHNVSFSLPGSKCLALIGHNGAGKTTLMKLILGLVKPSSGSIRVLGADPATGSPNHRRTIGFLPESIAFYEELTGRDNLYFYGRLRGIRPAACDVLLEQVGLTHVIGQRVRTYSKGMRQRLGLAQALLGTPRLLLLDEPTTGLDPALRQNFFNIVDNLVRDGTTVILSSHVLTELEASVNYVAILCHGTLVECGRLCDLQQQAKLPVRIRVYSDSPEEVVACLGSLAKDIYSVNKYTIDLLCQLPDKMHLLYHLSSLGDRVRDVDVISPGLSDLYLHFLRGHI